MKETAPEGDNAANYQAACGGDGGVFEPELCGEVFCGVGIHWGFVLAP